MSNYKEIKNGYNKSDKNLQINLANFKDHQLRMQ